MSSFHGRSASGCGLVPLTTTACLFAGGAESSGPPGRLRSSILTVSSDGGATVLAWRLISADDDDGSGERRRQRQHRSDHGAVSERAMRGRKRGEARVREGGLSCERIRVEEGEGSGKSGVRNQRRITCALATALCPVTPSLACAPCVPDAQAFDLFPTPRSSPSPPNVRSYCLLLHHERARTCLRKRAPSRLRQTTRCGHPKAPFPLLDS
jgi:hypothetical protein